ncbi:HNH endonuclease [Flavobacterium sp. NKUCC04_CG]|uniref:HNH endonuclease n=1 Tax=Flavobacterium sp. NKUCC04_CG TaxID=2842121 RepID=UPI001C5BB962|nr:HNH endonuclease signature motif containing protein [Flavobacterium sp. NKUCC04_CG]MBW3518327.1 HNH endonuclease [Flavobacterium sp. NKUCC04_CG]
MAKRIQRVKRPWIVKRKPFARAIANQSFYNSRTWRKLRRFFLDNNPLCVRCEANGMIIPATVADHIIPINKGGEPLNENNLQALCTPCHNSKSARDK